MNKALFALSILFAGPVFAIDDGFLECRQIADRDSRLACYDGLVDARTIRETPEAVRHADESDAAPPDAQSLFGTNDAESRRIVEESLDIEQIDEIVASVATVRESAGGKLTLTLDNGHVWKQLDSKSLRLNTGDPIVIRKASLGSFLLEKQSGSRRIRVRRIR